MAQVTLGVGTSHSPQLSTPLEEWPDTAERLKSFDLYTVPDGRPVTFLELDRDPPIDVDRELSEETLAARYAEAQAGIAWVGRAVQEADPDLIVVIGDDQKELFLADQLSALCVYWGDEVPIVPNRRMPVGQRWSYGWDDERRFTGAPAFGRHLIEHFCANGFDPAQSRVLDPGAGLGHAFGYVYRRVLDGRDVPLLPLCLNTYYPPNQPTPSRCYDIGRQIRAAVESFPQDLKVAIIGSGGLSHFVVDEGLDRMALDAMRAKDEAALRALPVERMKAGSSEIRNWVATAGAVAHLDMQDYRYVPGYRTRAGTGCGLSFGSLELTAVTIFLTNDDVADLLPIADCIETMDKLFKDEARGLAESFTRQSLNLPRGWHRTMSGGAYGHGAYGLKTYGAVEGRPKYRVLLFSLADGALEAILDAKNLSQIRTAAVSGLATRYMAREDAATIGIIGTGFEARGQVEAIAAVPPDPSSPRL